MLRFAIAGAVNLVVGGGAALAQASAIPAPPYYAMDPGTPVTPHAGSPVQQQVLENYRTQLLGVQREMLQQNPSGLTPDQLELSRRLNAYNLSSSPAAPSASNALPAPSLNVVPTPPFNAAPR